MRTRRPARLKYLSYTGHQRYSLTFCTDWKRKWFENAEAVHFVFAQFLRIAATESFSIFAYCFMPDHVHLLIEGLREDSDARKYIIKAKQCAARAYAMRFGQRLGQPFGYEHVLRDDEQVTTVARYILENPVRAGLVKSVLDYLFLGSHVCDVKTLIASLPDPD